MRSSRSILRYSIGAVAGACGRAAHKRWVRHDDVAMSAAELASGKGHKDENFPVASILIAKKHRPPVLAFYPFVRAADDVADHATATPDEKLALLEQMRASMP